MIIIVDANILFSALIKNGLTANILVQENFDFYAPSYLLKEFAKYEQIILEKTKRSKKDFEEIINILQKVINFVPKRLYSNFLLGAKNVCPDPKDMDYFALALKYDCSIWSNDKKLKEQDSVHIISTNELFEKIKKYK